MSRCPVRVWVLLIGLLAPLALAGCADGASVAGGGAGTTGGGGGSSADGGTSGPGGSAPGPARTSAPALRVETVAGNLENPWDVGFLPDGRLLVTERPGRLVLLSNGSPAASARPIAADFSDVLVRGEGGLMGLLVHPDFATSRRFITCQTHTERGQPVDVRLVTWELSADGASARRVRDPLVGGLPVNPSGRHSGCRPTLAPDGALLVGTGDSARVSTIPQDRANLGGKVLRVDLATGGPAPGNPFAGSANANERLVWTYGHRNIQGVTIQPGTGTAFSTEHGPTVDDEVNRLEPGRNYGWDPSRGGTVGGYNERVPMTDLARFPDAVPAKWSSGSPTEAIAGSAFLAGARWGRLDGALAVPALRGTKLLVMTVGGDGAVTEVSVPAELDSSFGRLRTARLSPAGELYLTSDNGSGDVILRVTPG